jgi:hypothetical protein
MKKLFVLLLLALANVVSAANVVYPLDCEANARAKIADFCEFSKQRTPTVLSTWASLETKWGLVHTDSSTFGWLASAKATNVVSIVSGSKNMAAGIDCWTAADVGKTIHVQGAGTAGGTLVTTIATFSTARTIVLSDAAVTTVSATKTSKGGIAAWGFLPTLTIETSPLLSNDGTLAFVRSGPSGSDVGGALVVANGIGRTVAAKFSDIVNVRDFGAVGNGLTNDNAAIAAAIASLPTGGTVYFPPGNYLTSAQFVLPRYINLAGAGYHSTKITVSGGSNCFVINSTSGDNKISGLELIGSGGGSKGVYIIDFTGFTNVYDCNINGFGLGIDVTSSSWTDVVNCRISSNTIGVRISASGSEFTTTFSMRKCRVNNNTQYGFVNSSTGPKCSSFVFDTVNIEYNGSATYPQVDLGPVDNVLFSGCYFEHSGPSYATTISTVSANTDCVTISNCYFNGANYHIECDITYDWSIIGCRFIGAQAANSLRMAGAGNSQGVVFITTDFDKAPALTLKDYTYIGCTGTGIPVGLAVGGSAPQVTFLSLPSVAGASGTLYRDASNFVKVSP